MSDNLTQQQVNECKEVYEQMQKYFWEQILNRLSYGQSLEQAIKEELEIK